MYMYLHVLPPSLSLSLLLQEIYDLMLDCWNVNPTERPKATEIADGLERWTPDLSAQIEVIIYM